jgi:hypothetical protein
MNKRGLHDTMVGRKACSSEEFEDFFYGFSQSSPRFLVVDVGQGLQGADAKIKGVARFSLGSESLLKLTAFRVAGHVFAAAADNANFLGWCAFFLHACNVSLICALQLATLGSTTQH